MSLISDLHNAHAGTLPDLDLDLVKFDFTAVLTGTGNRSEELKKL